MLFVMCSMLLSVIKLLLSHFYKPDTHSCLALFVVPIIVTLLCGLYNVPVRWEFIVTEEEHLKELHAYK